ncbi:SIR2 family protein [Rhizobium rhizogenes]|uniref:SIR2 family protein n=1 Tax=Rhizobium rhizogenes TaxID=359 RepID=UPI0022C85E91|nr:SIR2 family protein [Rhizobium rhizogenes]MCZ7486051.1 SIR2 family protein [Rhizobium rhizogenes]
MVSDKDFEPFSFWKGAQDFLKTKDGTTLDASEAVDAIRSQLGDALNARNLSFLFGSGCSSYRKNGAEVGIPTMGPMAKSFLETVGESDEAPHVSAGERKILKQWLGLEIGATKFANNLERLMEALYGAKFVYEGTEEPNPKVVAAVVDRVIGKVAKHVLDSCTNGAFAEGDETVLSLYQNFYQKLQFRDRSLPRPWIFTTNYDLFNERAMDRRGIPYCNGFSGVVERRFNPAMFRYSLAEQLDISSRKWSAVDNFIYLVKLHGSVNWIEDGETLFPARELAEVPSSPEGRVLIYPTPAKQSASFVSPYADLFREFQTRVVQDQSVLVTCGYSFGDQHINNIIFQALTIPNFRLIIFAAEDAEGVIKQLRQLGDPRIWHIGSDMFSRRSAHYFDAFVERFMPELPGTRIESAVEKVLHNLIAKKAMDEENSDGDR